MVSCRRDEEGSGGRVWETETKGKGEGEGRVGDWEADSEMTEHGQMHAADCQPDNSLHAFVLHRGLLGSFRHVPHCHAVNVHPRRAHLLYCTDEF